MEKAMVAGMWVRTDQQHSTQFTEKYFGLRASIFPTTDTVRFHAPRCPFDLSRVKIGQDSSRSQPRPKEKKGSERQRKKIKEIVAEMPLEKIYVARHGFRSNWLVDPLTGTYSAHIPSPTGIPADPTLTSHGVRQSKELASHLVTLDPPIEAVYSSPFYRCLETLSPFVTLQLQKQEQGRTGGRLVSETAMIRLERGIQEWFGSAPFDHPEPATADVLKTLFPTINGEYRSVVSPSKRGETLAELQDRVAVALRAIIDRCDAEGTRAVLLCSHAAVIIVLGRILTGQVPEAADTDDFYAYTCGLSVFRRAAPVEEGRVQGPRPLSADRGTWRACSCFAA
ncbi:Transcription factor tau 55 kDa subunit [Drechmeria coniospora]|uniref:Transcription factor tau 55 kDa subunit n=1 Tax=Drechmeria coniospora TaxID=98403 RepID=A0A151GL95_DRECN|nr:Transcription factor tau 55 kDa subunit [Drechmeria coniospora]KYK57801.1 Transcription factor tau 55 kDa subunit [Drechmeria coniospora]